MFEERINVVWGASNSGKSYIVKALDLMSGAKTPLPPITEAQGYDKCWLELELPVSRTVTLSRAMKGGDFGLHIGSIDPESAGRLLGRCPGIIAERARACRVFCLANSESARRKSLER
ncbi:P-loop NTPase family protein [Bradyrhizobium sp. 195]|uniref:hypothetical protein n=1 Tax=Bradyrhizobium sp. 195 TaxID=2782662 RepID=UPI0020016411|nr:hypothetical protein [Bradyrhizobium sp. 195]UPK26552.1 hypothetical protein IVB26_35825 [Bradyrhizobium sp. 195]